MNDHRGFLAGVIEGFYGRQWPFQARKDYAAYLATAGLNTYLYCPKGDPYLRKCWRECWPPSQFEALRSLGDSLSGRGLAWGVGLSPYELYRDYGRKSRDQLRRKVGEIEGLEAPLFAILFDDMPGAAPDLAQRQAEIVNDIASWDHGSRLLVCPTYYSFDPALAKHFGDMPEHYWEDLGSHLPEGLDVFWTGNRVCSEEISIADVEAITQRLGRKVMLWDNYPVNDGAVRSNFLYTQPLSGRPSELRERVTGHLCNPMNQPLLSLPAVAGLAKLYGLSGLDEGQLIGILGSATWAQLQSDRASFQFQGLSGLGQERCLSLAQVYEGLPGNAAREVADWLRGEYSFDPACLTD